MQELLVSWTDLHLQCSATKERSKGQSRQGHLRTPRNPETTSNGQCRASRLWTRCCTVSRCLCSHTEPLVDGAHHLMCRLLFRQPLPNTTHHSQTKGRRNNRTDGEQRRSLLSGHFSLRLHADSAEHGSTWKYTIESRVRSTPTIHTPFGNHIITRDTPRTQRT